MRTGIASSPDRGSTWADLGVDPNGLAASDFEVPDGSGGRMWATWRFEVSRLGGCAAYTEPGTLVRSDGIYVSRIAQSRLP